jgi:hypothetical protein
MRFTCQFERSIVGRRPSLHSGQASPSGFVILSPDQIGRKNLQLRVTPELLQAPRGVYPERELTKILRFAQDDSEAPTVTANGLRVTSETHIGESITQTALRGWGEVP